MRLISKQEHLKRGLNIVGHVTVKNINLPILNNILIKAESGDTELISTNLEIGVIYKLRGKVESPGELTVDSKLITEYVNLLDGDNAVSLEEKDGELSVKCNNYKTKIKTEPTKEFPLIPVISQDAYFSCDPEELRKSLNSVIFSVSNSENRVELTGVLFSFKEGVLNLAATDSYRLAEKKLSVKSVGMDQEQSVIVPSKTVQELLRVLNNIDQEIEGDLELRISLSDNQILFTVDSVSLISRLINGHYPDYQQIIPNKSLTEVIVDRAELVRAVKAAALFSKTGINDVDLKVIKDKLVVSSFSGASGESQIEISVKTSGEDNDISINYRYLIDGLNNIDSQSVVINILNNTTPCLLKPEGGKDYLYIVMPIKQ